MKFHFRAIVKILSTLVFKIVISNTTKINLPQNNILYDFEDEAHYPNVILNGELDYFQPFENDFRIGLNSEVINKGDLNIANSTPLDIIETARIPNPDLGAYQAIEKDL